MPEFIPLKGTLKPSGDFPGLEGRYINLSFRAVLTTQERNNIPRSLRTFPMWVLVSGTPAVLYSLKAEPGSAITTNADWEPIALGADFDNGINYQDNYNAATNTPDIKTNIASYNVGDYFIANVAGLQDFGSGAETVNVNDWLIKTSSGQWKVIPQGTVVTWDNLQGKPSEFNPSAHTHLLAEITDFPSILASIPATGDDNSLATVKAIRDWVAANGGVGSSSFSALREEYGTFDGSTNQISLNYLPAAIIGLDIDTVLQVQTVNYNVSGSVVTIDDTAANLNGKTFYVRYFETLGSSISANQIESLLDDYYGNTDWRTGTGGTGGPAVAERYATWALLLADQANQESGFVYFAADASGFSTVDSGYAYFEYLGTTNGNESDYRKLTEGESMDLDLSSKADKATGHTTGNLAELDASGNPVDSGKSVAQLSFSSLGVFNPASITMASSGSYDDYTTTGNVTLSLTGGVEGTVRTVQITFNGTHTLSWSGVDNLINSNVLASSGSAPAAGTYDMLFSYYGGKYKINLIPIDADAGPVQLSEPSLSTSVISDTQINITVGTVLNASSYVLEWSPNGTDTWTQLTTSAGTYNHTSLTGSTQYFYRSRAIGDGVNYTDSGYSTANATTNSSATQLSAPANMTAIAVGESQINIAWDDVANEDSYQLEWSPNGTDTWTQIGGTIVANTTSYQHTPLSAGTQYFYRLKAVGDGVTYTDSQYSTANATTDAADVIEPTLSNISVDNIQLNSALLNAQSNETGKIYWAAYPTADAAHTRTEIENGTGAIDFGVMDVTAGITKGDVANGLTSSTAYKFHLFAEDQASTPNRSNVSLTSEFTTLASDTTKPVFLSAVILNSAKNIVEIDYNEQLNSTAPATTAYSLSNTSRTVQSISISGNKVLITVDADFLYNEFPQISYTVPGSNPVQDTSGNTANAFTNVSITNRIESTGTYDAYSEALFARFTTDPGATRKGHIDTLIKGLKDDGIWEKLSLLQVYAAHEADSAVLNWLVNFSNAVNNNATFTIDSGYTGNGTDAYINTNFNNSLSQRISQNSICVFGWELTNIAEAKPLWGYNKSSSQTLLYPRMADNTLRVSVNEASPAVTPTATNSTSTGFHLIRRSNASQTEYWKDGTLIETLTKASNAFSDADYFALAQNNWSTNNVPAAFSNRQIAVFGVANSNINVNALYTRLQTFLTAIGTI